LRKRSIQWLLAVPLLVAAACGEPYKRTRTPVRQVWHTESQAPSARGALHAYVVLSPSAPLAELARDARYLAFCRAWERRDAPVNGLTPAQAARLEAPIVWPVRERAGSVGRINCDWLIKNHDAAALDDVCPEIRDLVAQQYDPGECDAGPYVILTRRRLVARSSLSSCGTDLRLMNFTGLAVADVERRFRELHRVVYEQEDVAPLLTRVRNNLLAIGPDQLAQRCREHDLQ
jgi:hypothetical protein